MKDLRYYVPGGSLIMLAILIMAVPEILIALVAAVITLSGMAALYIGHMIRKSAQYDREWFWDVDERGRRFVRIPVSRVWHRDFRS